MAATETPNTQQPIVGPQTGRGTMPWLAWFRDVAQTIKGYATSFTTAIVTAGRMLFSSDGTAAAPVLAWEADTNLGLFRAGTDALGVATAGVERVRIDASGNVGIGTTTPYTTLEVVGADNPFLVSGYGSPNAGMIGRKAQGTLAAPTAVTTNNYLSFFGGRGYQSNDAWSGNAGLISIRAAEGFTGAANGTYLSLETTPIGSTSRVPAVRIDSAGNVGIGTTAPLAKLAINGGLHVGGDSNPGDNNALIDGTLTVNGDVRVTGDGTFEVAAGAWDDLVVPAVAINPTGIASAMTPITDAAGWLGCLLAVNTGTPTCVFQWQLSHTTQLGQDLYPHVHWVKDDGADNAGTVVWEANFRVCGRNGSASAWTGFSAGTLADDPGDNANYGAATEWTLANSTYNFGISDLIVMVLRRNGGTSGDAVVLSGDIHFPKVRLGSKYRGKLTSASTSASVSASSSPSAT